MITILQLNFLPVIMNSNVFSYKSYFFGRNILGDDFAERALIGNYQKLGLYKNNKLLILSPQKKSEIIEDPYNSDTIREAKQTDQLVLETMAYYQGANYILKHKLNRWSENDEGKSFFISRLPSKQ